MDAAAQDCPGKEAMVELEVALRYLVVYSVFLERSLQAGDLMSAARWANLHSSAGRPLQLSTCLPQMGFATDLAAVS